MPPGGLPACWMWWQGCHLMHRYVGVCGVNGKHRPPLTGARWPHPSQDSPPTPQYSIQGSVWPSPTFLSGFIAQYFASCPVCFPPLVTKHSLGISTSGPLLQLLPLPGLLFLPTSTCLRPPGQLQCLLPQEAFLIQPESVSHSPERFCLIFPVITSLRRAGGHVQSFLGLPVVLGECLTHSAVCTLP